MTEWNASEYDRIAALQAAMAEEALSLLEVQGTERVLDIGCGQGRITCEIAGRIPHGRVLGVDASEKMIAFAREHATASPQPNLDFAVGDARHLAFDHEFDLIVSFNALHWIPEQSMALDSIRAALKPSGIAQIRLVPKGARKSLEDTIEETRFLPRWAQYFDGFQDPYLHLTPEEYASLAEQRGFKVLRNRTSDKIWDFQSHSAFEAFGSVTFIAWTQHLPEAARMEFVNNVLQQYRYVACTRPGEENYFRFYQMDITLAGR